MTENIGDDRNNTVEQVTQDVSTDTDGSQTHETEMKDNQGYDGKNTVEQVSTSLSAHDDGSPTNETQTEDNQGLFVYNNYRFMRAKICKMCTKYVSEYIFFGERRRH